MALLRRGGPLAMGAVCVLWAGTAEAEFPLTASPPAPIDFAGFAGAGFDPDPDPDQLDSDIWVVRGVSDGDLAFGDSENSGDYAEGVSTGEEAEGGVWAWDTGGGNVALGANLTGMDFTPGSFVLRAQNTTGVDITSLDVSWRVWALNNGNRSNVVEFAWSQDDAAYTAVADQDFASVEASDNLGWQSETRTTTISGITLASDEFLYLRWVFDDSTGNGSRDELGIDDIEFFVNDICGNGAVEIGEQCDDENDIDTDACVQCLDAVCGDGFVQAGVEMCDDGNMNNTDACPDGDGGTCEDAVCGDGFVFADNEDCDDMNKVDDDECPNDCTIEAGTTGTGGTTTGDPGTTTSGGTTDGVEGSGGSTSGEEETANGGTTAGAGTTSGTGTGTGTNGATVSTTTPATGSTTEPGTGSDTDSEFSGESAPGCACRSTPGNAGVFALMLLAFVRRRRS